jgi:Toprim domain
MLWIFKAPDRIGALIMAYLGQTFYTKDLPIENDIGLKPYFLNKEQILDVLLNDLPSHLKTLYPQGKIKGNSFYIGNIAGDSGDSLVITLSGIHKGKWTDFSTNEHGDIFLLCAYSFNLDTKTQFKALLQRLSEYLGLSQSESKPLSDAEIQAIKAKHEAHRLRAIQQEQEALELTLKKQETALKLWNDAICINHPTAQEYLKARGLDIQFNMHVMRYLPEAWHSELKMNLPCIIALVRDTKGTPYILNNGKHLIGQNEQPILEYKPLGIERHYLPPEPQATPEAYKQWFTDRGISRRKILGSKKQGVVMLNGCNPCHERLILTEGIITAYSIMFNITDKNCTVKNASNPLGGMYWSFLGVNNLRDIIIPEHIKEIIYFVDNDKAGNQSIEFLEQNNTVKGRNNNDLKITIKRLKRTDTKDFNDLITKKKPVTTITITS